MSGTHLTQTIQYPHPKTILPDLKKAHRAAVEKLDRALPAGDSLGTAGPNFEAREALQTLLSYVDLLVLAFEKTLTSDGAIAARQRLILELVEKPGISVQELRDGIYHLLSPTRMKAGRRKIPRAA